MKYCLTEDADRFRFAPFTTLRPADTLLLGTTTIYVKWQKELGNYAPERLAPDVLGSVWNTADALKSDCYLNSRVLPSAELILAINQLKKGQRLCSSKGDVLAIKPTEPLSRFIPIDSIPFSEEITFPVEKLTILHHVWEITTKNGREIFNDVERFSIQDNRDATPRKTVLIDGPHPVFIDDSAIIEPGVTLLAYDGPIIIQKNALVMTGTMIRGPVSIGEYAVLKMGGHIYGETSIGEHCRVGGEVKSAVFHRYSNKAHGGYIGNAVVGEWCNWGAHTNCSNLKNNYSQVSLARFPDGKSEQTGQQFLGVMMGDHTKTAINTSINTGSVFGVMCNIADSGFPPKFLPHFSWLVNGKTEKYNLDKAMETVRLIMSRRNVALTDEEIAVFKTVWENAD